MRISFEVRRNGQFLCFASRAVRQHSGWESVTYEGKRYQLLGGERVPYFISLGTEYVQDRSLEAQAARERGRRLER